MQGWTTPPQETQQGTTATPSSHQPTAFTAADFGRLLFKRKWIIVALVVLGVLYGVYRNKSTQTLYEASSRVDLNLGQSADIGINGVLQQGMLGGFDPDEALQTQVQIMRSATVALDAIKMLNLYNTPPFSDVFEKKPYDGTLTPRQREALVRMFQGATVISVVPNTQLVDVRFMDHNPEVAMKAANAIVDAYMQRDLQARYQGTMRISGWLGKQLTGLKEEVTKDQQALADYVQQHNLISVGDQGSLAGTTLSTVNQQLAEARADRIVKEARYKMALTRNPELLVSVAPNTTLASMRQEEANLMIQKAQLRSKFGPSYPQLQELNRQLASVKADINKEINGLTQRFAVEYHTAVKTEALLQAQLDAQKQKAFQANQSEAQYEMLKHTAATSAALYDALELKLQEAGITAGMNSSDVDVIDRATVPLYPILPKKRSNLVMGFFGGLLVGLILAFVLERLDDTVRTSEDAENVTHMPTLAVVPHFVFKKSAVTVTPRGKSNILPDVVSWLEPHSLGAEAFRTLRSAIMLSVADREPKMLMITSGLAEEGKSTTAANLAVCFAQRQEKVLLVDTDLRRGTTHLKFGMSNRVGLSTVLTRESGEEAYEHPLPDLPGLAVLSHGPSSPYPGELLASQAMKDLMAQWKGTYDRIILDTSPVLAVSDSLSLAVQADLLMILVRAGVTRKKALMRTREVLLRSGARVSGTVVNDVDLRLEHYYTYSKRYGYGYKSNYGTGYGATDGKD